MADVPGGRALQGRGVWQLALSIWITPKARYGTARVNRGTVRHHAPHGVRRRGMGLPCVRLCCCSPSLRKRGQRLSSWFGPVMVWPCGAGSGRQSGWGQPHSETFCPVVGQQYGINQLWEHSDALVTGWLRCHRTARSFFLFVCFAVSMMFILCPDWVCLSGVRLGKAASL